MTVEPYAPFLLQISGTRWADGAAGICGCAAAQLDDGPTAPFNLIAARWREAGLKVSEEAATVRSITGRPMQVRMTVIRVSRSEVGSVSQHDGVCV